MMFPHSLIPGGTVTLSVTNVSGSVALGGPSQATSQGARQTWQVVITSPVASAAIAFIRFGLSTDTAVATTDYPILPGTIQVFTVNANLQPYLVAVTAASTATLYASVGYGE